MDFDTDSQGEQFKRQGAIVRPRRLPRFQALEEMTLQLSPFERLALYVLTIVLAVSSFALLAGANAAVSVSVPSQGGSLVEGQIGPARFINPLIPMSQADSDITALVYSGLTRAQADGTIVPDLASHFEISEDGTSYTFTVRDGITFHDGTPVTSADVLFTVQRAQNPDIKSVHRADWEGVSVSTPDERTVIFKLPRAYAPFLHNTTMGILPRHLWQDVTPEEFPFSPLNTNPVGSGPYKVGKVVTSSTGSVMRYDLEAFKGFALGAPYLRQFSFVFFPNEDALMRAFNKGEVDSVAGISPNLLGAITREDITVHTVPLPRIFGVFFNQGRSASLADVAVRRALDQAIVKERVVQLVLRGYGVAIDSPVPPHVLSIDDFREAEGVIVANTAYTDESLATARATLEKGGWTFDEATASWTNSKKQELSFSLATAETPELVETANAIAAAWLELGVKVNVQVFPISELNTNVIRPREYDALLFGEVVGRELDLFAFWHSSQRNDPGLNVALYTNSRADTLLSQARATTQIDERKKLYAEFGELVKSDVPAVFLYSPKFIYAVPKSLLGLELGSLSRPAERFHSAYRWYTDTEKVWSIFTDQNQR